MYPAPSMENGESLDALQAEFDRDQQELLELVEETHCSLEQKLRVSFARLRTLSRHHAVASGVTPSLSVVSDACAPLCSGRGQATLQPKAPEVDPFPALRDDGVPVSVRVEEALGLENVERLPSDSEWTPSPGTTRPAALQPSGSAGNLPSPTARMDFLRLTDGTTMSGISTMRELVQRYIDYVAGVLVLLNTILMLVELELEGRATGAEIGLSSDTVNFHDLEPVFRQLDTFFVYVYTLELLIRIWGAWPTFHRSIANWFDVLLVASGLVPGLRKAPLQYIYIYI